MMPRVFAVVLVFVSVYALDTTTPKPPGPGEGQPPFPGPVPIIEVKDVGVIGGEICDDSLYSTTKLPGLATPKTTQSPFRDAGISGCHNTANWRPHSKPSPSCCPILICGGI
ncbi:hypothetical protein MTO96_048046 [Rhipicephalus appendiculatus]